MRAPRVVVLSSDDDNNNAVEDYKEKPVAGETSLRSLKIEWKVNGVMVFLKKGQNADKIKVWKDKEKRQEITFDGQDNRFNRPPQEVFIEGVSPSAAMNDVELFANFTNKDDKKPGSTVTFTVLWVDHWSSRSGQRAVGRQFLPMLDPRMEVGGST
jgi:hypothetical protein